MPPENMKYSENDLVSYHYNSSKAVHACIAGLCGLAENSPLLLEPLKGNDEKKINALLDRHPTADSSTENKELPFPCDRIPILYMNGFYLLPTVEKTTLFYSSEADCFLKIIHPLTLKNKLLSFVADRARNVYDLSENLLSKGVKAPKIYAYGTFKKGRKAFYAMERIRGSSLYDMLVKKKETLPDRIYYTVVDALADLHNFGYWFGDLRIAHILIKDNRLSGFVDIDGIKKNLPFRLKNIAKDLAGLNQPELPLTKDEKRTLLDYYISKSGIDDKTGLENLVRHYSRRRWGG